jgi:hypothetical protein
MLALFWAPVALLGLHAFIETRRTRWLALYAACWALQAAANGYALVFFSLLIGLWIVWFVVARRDWLGVAANRDRDGCRGLVLSPILYTYVTVHARHGFVRGVEEIQSFSADMGAVLCAPELLTFWAGFASSASRKASCFPGVGTAALFVVGCSRSSSRRAVG